MQDIEMAKKRLIEKDLKLVAVKDGVVIFESQESGINPMYILAREKRILAKDSSIADRVIGKGAALLCAHIGIKKLYADLMSRAAIEVLREYGIEYEYKNTCQYVMNRDKTGSCPIEEMSEDIEDPVVLLKRIEEFLDK